MGLFSNIKSAIFGNKEQDKFLEDAAKPQIKKVEPKSVAEGGTSTDEQVAYVPTPDASPEVIHVSAQAQAPDPTPASSALPESAKVDVAAELDAKATAHPEDLDWQKSIVDLMKLVDMDSSYANRKELALELGYSQDDIDDKGSAEMNMWLHKQVLAKLAADSNGDTSRLMV